MTGFDLARVQGFVLDLDGTTYIGARLLPGACRFVSLLRTLHRPFLFVTNNSSADAGFYAAKLRRLGLDADPRDILTSGEATARYLRGRGYRRPFVVGTAALVDEFSRAGFHVDDESPDCVVLGFDTSLTYAKLEKATLLLRRGVPFVATHPDLVCPTERGFIPDCGSMIALLRAASGVEPEVVGKPEPTLVRMALEKLGLPASQVAVVGDRLYTDMAMARRAGTAAILVLSGETTAEMLETAVPGSVDLVVADLGALADALGRAIGVDAPTRPARH